MKAKTVHTYEGFVTRYLLPDLGFVPLSKLGAAAIKQHYSRLLERGLSPTTVHHVHAMLHKAMNDAMHDELIARNPCEYVKPPARRKSHREVWSETDTLFLEAAKSSRYSVLYLLACTTGLRPAELLGLRWQDIDFERMTLRVTQTLVRPHGGGFIFETPKTPKSCRVVAIPSEVVTELKAHKARQNAEFLQRGPAYRNLGLVFAQPNGLPLHEHNVTQRDFRRIVKKAGLSPIRFYDLRHTHLTHLIMRGVPLPVVQERAGHASGAFTLQTYIHSLPGAQQQAVQATSAMLQGANGLLVNPGVLTEDTRDGAKR